MRISPTSSHVVPGICRNAGSPWTEAPCVRIIFLCFDIVAAGFLIAAYGRFLLNLPITTVLTPLFVFAGEFFFTQLFISDLLLVTIISAFQSETRHQIEWSGIKHWRENTDAAFARHRRALVKLARITEPLELPYTDVNGAKKSCCSCCC